MTKIYFAISYSKRYLFDNEINLLKTFFNDRNIELLVFVDKYNFKPDEEKIMMETAFREIDSSDFLVAELTTKSIGVGIEIGYAYAKEIPIIYIRKSNSEYSTTASGSSKYTFEYENENHLITLMDELFKKIN